MAEMEGHQTAGIRLPLPTGVRAVVTEYGENQADAIDRCISIEAQPPPLLSELQNDDIVVAVRASEVVWTDTIMATGQYQHQARLPYTPGMTYAGVVVWAGSTAQRRGVVEGQRVAVAGDAGPRSYGRHQRWGGCATYAVAPMRAVRPVPAAWSFEEAASFAYGFDTAYHVLVERGRLQPGETILIQGAAGGVGIPAVRMAKMLGATVIAATRSPAKCDFLRSVGADHVVVIGGEDGVVGSFREEVKALTAGGDGVDVVYDGVGGDAITLESMRCCRFGARILVVGWAATADVAQGKGRRGAPNVNRIPTNLIMMKGLTVLGCPAAISVTKDPSLVERRYRDLHQWFEEGRLPPPKISSVFPLEDIRAALRARVKSGGEVGATIVQPPFDGRQCQSKL